MLFADTANDADGGLVGAGQKSGVFWTFRAKDGKPIWSRQVTPGGVTGGLQWGSATDGRPIYVAAANVGPSTNGGGRGALPWTLKDGSTTKAGGWAALDAKTGAVQWTTPDPDGWVDSPNGSPNRAEGAVSLANGVMFGCNLAGKMYGLDAKTGAVLRSYNSGATCNAGPSIADGVVYWGSGALSATARRRSSPSVCDAHGSGSAYRRLPARHPATPVAEPRTRTARVGACRLVAAARHGAV